MSQTAKPWNQLCFHCYPNTHFRRPPKLHLMLHSIVAARGFLCPFVTESRSQNFATENEKTLGFTRKTRVFISEVDGARTRNLRIDSPVL